MSCLRFRPVLLRASISPFRLWRYRKGHRFSCRLYHFLHRRQPADGLTRISTGRIFRQTARDSSRHGAKRTSARHAPSSWNRSLSFAARACTTAARSGRAGRPGFAPDRAGSCLRLPCNCPTCAVSRPAGNMWWCQRSCSARRCGRRLRPWIRNLCGGNIRPSEKPGCRAPPCRNAEWTYRLPCILPQRRNTRRGQRTCLLSCGAFRAYCTKRPPLLRLQADIIYVVWSVS